MTTSAGRASTRAQSAAAARSAASSASSTRAIVRDFSRGASSPLEISFDVRTTYDFVFSLSDDAGSTEDLLPADREWLTEAKTTLRGRVGAEAMTVYGSELCIPLAGLAVDRPSVRDAAGFAALVNDLPNDTIIRTILAADLRDPDRHELAERALAGDSSAVDELFKGTTEKHPADKYRAMRAIYQDAASILEPARAVLNGWVDLFGSIESRIASMIRNDADARTADVATLDSADLIERTTGGIRWLAEPGVRRVILAPSYFSRPYNFVLGGSDWRLFGYPIADSALDGGDPLAPPQAVIRLHRALGDDTRLRILRLLAGRDHYLTEIATALELSKPTIKHHLALLRAAGLVTVTEEGGLSYYSLRRGTVETAGHGLSDYLRN